MLLFCPQVVRPGACIPGEQGAHTLQSNPCTSPLGEDFSRHCLSPLAFVAPQPYFPAEAAKLLELLAPPAVNKLQLPASNLKPMQPGSQPGGTVGAEAEPAMLRLQAADAALQAAREAAAAALAASFALPGSVAAQNEGQEEGQQQQHVPQQILQAEQQTLHQQEQPHQQQVGSPPACTPSLRPCTQQAQEAQSVGMPILPAAAAGIPVVQAAGGSSAGTLLGSSSASRLSRSSRPSSMMLGVEPVLPERDIAPGGTRTARTAAQNAVQRAFQRSYASQTVLSHASLCACTASMMVVGAGTVALFPQRPDQPVCDFYQKTGHCR